MQQIIIFIKNKVSYGTLLLLGILASIPFSIRYVFPGQVANLTGAYSDFTSFSLYFCDLIILACFMWNRKKIIKPSYLLILVIIWLILELILNFGQFWSLQLYFSSRIGVLLILLHVVSKYEINTLKSELISWIMVILGVLQAFTAFFQFYYQKSIGLSILGESILDPNMYGVAKIVAHGTKLVRGYGTFPHPNLLAAFLVVSSTLNLYLLTKNYQEKIKFILSLTFLINILGLFVTFSRGGVSAMLIGTFLFLGFIIWQKQYHMFKKLAYVSFSSIMAAIIIFYPYLSTRTTISDNAVLERYFYNSVGVKIIKDNWLLGTGPGTSVLHMEQYAQKKLETWEIQPIHNYYLLAIAEWGIGALFLLSFLIWILYKLIYKTYLDTKNTDSDSMWGASLSVIGISFFYLFMFDHYFYTIWPTQVLLWLFFGLMLAEINRKVPR